MKTESEAPVVRVIHVEIVEGLLVNRIQVDDEEYQIVYDPHPISQRGDNYDLTCNRIVLQDEHVGLNFEKLPDALRPHILSYVSYSLSRNAEVTIANKFFLLVSLFRGLDADDDIEDAIKQRCIAALTKGSENEIDIPAKSMLRTFYRFAIDENMPYFDEDFLEYYLEHLIFGSDPRKGMDVLIEMKNRGCLTVKENRTFRRAVHNVDKEAMSMKELQGFISLRIAQVTGARDVQVRNLKVKHVGQEEGHYYLDIPRAKQRGANKRKQLKRRLVTPKLAGQIQYLIERMKRSSKKTVMDEDHLISNLTNSGQYYTNRKTTGPVYRHRIIACREFLRLDFKVTNRRLRKTFCTTLVAQGRPLKVIAELMDHQDLQQLQVYYRQTKNIAKKLGDIFKKEFSDVLDAFEGKVVHRGEESQEGQLIFADIKDMGLCDIGSCGSGTPCSKSPPLSCYSCSSVELFEDADHQSVMDQFIANATETFGEIHAKILLESDELLGLRQAIKQIEGGHDE